MMSTLPTSRAFLTSIINTLTTPLPTQQTTQQPADLPYDAPSNPLKSLPSSHRALLTSLHVLFPPPMLLQSLDLLDRGLVTRLILESPDLEHTIQDSVPERKKETEVWPPQAHVHLPASNPHSGHENNERKNEPKNEEKRNEIYIVRSSQPTKGRYASITTGTRYTVHLEAWNCSCAAFAFSAFPASSQASPWNLSRDEDDEDVEMDLSENVDEGKWEFGGSSLDGKNGGGGVPVCKHLLACLFGERWKDVMGGYVKVKMVSREEMAGYGAE